ncbi:hypothetical protein DSO57_1008018 [Entomophthora muscae]|uniref:Uncharacterized protein n=1 Tax=Entomophthora muscae TaxID=34485 RepID=A0ACC2US39_9FUNG|nr:hypothetical protein DSO57_1008018 [Entomophthora muscae]
MYILWKYQRRFLTRRCKISLSVIAAWVTFSVYTFIAFINPRNLIWDQAESKTANNQLKLQVNFHKFVPATQEATLDYEISSIGAADKVQLIINGDEHTLEWGVSKEVKIKFSCGANRDVFAYPFDAYWKLLSIQTKLKSEVVPFSLAIKTSNKEFILTHSVFEPNSFVLSLHRTWLVKFFSIFVNFVMWLLAWGIFNVTVDTWHFRRSVTGDCIAASFGLIFALPSVREAQPGIPAIGCGIDFVGFMW